VDTLDENPATKVYAKPSVLDELTVQNAALEKMIADTISYNNKPNKKLKRHAKNALRTVRNWNPFSVSGAGYYGYYDPSDEVPYSSPSRQSQSDYSGSIIPSTRFAPTAPPITVPTKSIDYSYPAWNGTPAQHMQFYGHF